MNDLILSTKPTDDLVNEIANEVVRKMIGLLKIKNQSEENDRWFNLIELCEYLPDKPTRATVYSWVHYRKIPFHKGSKHLRFLKSEIDAWLKQSRVKTNAEIAQDVDNYLINEKIKG